jgi:hypothetical protein
MPELITDSNQQLLEQVREDLRALREDVAVLLSAWRENEAVLGAFRRGGVLAARTAARRNGNGKP